MWKGYVPANGLIFLLISNILDISQTLLVYSIKFFPYSIPKSISWFPRQDTSILSPQNNFIICWPQKIELIKDGEKKSPENRTSFSFEL